MRNQRVSCLVGKVLQKHASEVVLPKTANLNLEEPLDPNANLQEIQRAEKQVRNHQGDTVGKIQTKGNSS